MEWISVEDHKPEPWENYLVSSLQSIGGEIWRTPHVAMYYENESWISIEAVILKNVTHWMPLPELPKDIDGNP